VIDRVGLTREANLTVVEVANRVLLLGVTAQGVTMLADLDPLANLEDPDIIDEYDQVGDYLDPDEEAAEQALRAAREQTQANSQPGLVPDRMPADIEPGSQRRPIPSGVALDQYPDLASALRAAGRTAATSRADGPAGPVTEPEDLSPSPDDANPASTPRTRAEARAEARARASLAARSQAAAQARPAAAPPKVAIPMPMSTQVRPMPSTSSEVERVPVQRRATETAGKARVVPRPTPQASGSVLSPRTWRQGIEALRDLTVRRG
jgi:hypothetical protein